MRFGKTSLKNLSSGVDPRLVIFATAVLVELPEFDITVTSGRRTLEEQKKLVERGVSKTLKSKHIEGLAIDFQPHNHAQLTTEGWIRFCKKAQKIADRLGFPIKNGGLMWGWDYYHWEIK